MSGDSPVKSLGLFGNPRKEDLQPAVSTIISLCKTHGVDVHLSRELARLLGRHGEGLPDRKLVAAADVVVALGGDGTMLRAARTVGHEGTPILGINLGSLGYLTDIPVEGLTTSLERVFAGDYKIVGRSRVHCAIWRGQEIIAEVSGLNDVVVNMGPLPRTLDLELRLDGTALGRFLGDGVIFATATGSTAYSLSAGGAICQHELPGMLVTPICPHSLGVRPLILGDDVEVELMIHEVGNGATLTADGQVATPLLNKDRLTCHLTPPVVKLIKFKDSNFFSVLRQKLNWGVAPSIRVNSRRWPSASPGADEVD